MNEQQNTALIQKVYAAFGRGDIKTILDSLTADVEWTLEGPEIIPFAGKRKGVPQVVGFFEALASTQVDLKLTTEHWVAQGDKVATFGRYAGTVKATGKKFNTPVAHLFIIRDGKVSQFLDLGDTAAFAEAYRTSSSAAH
jgi:ketosteroid isomerase-like protein